MDIVRWLSLVLFGCFFIGLIVVYELSLFDKELTSLLSQFASKTVVFVAREEDWSQIFERRTKQEAKNRDNFWVDVDGQQNQQVIRKDKQPVPGPIGQPKSRFERFSKIRYASQKMKLSTLSRLGHLLSRQTVQEIHRQETRVEALKANYDGSEWKDMTKAVYGLECTVFDELASKDLIQEDVKEMVLSAVEILAEMAKEPLVHRHYTKMFYMTKRMRAKAILQALRQHRQLPHGQFHMSSRASLQFNKQIKPLLDERLADKEQDVGKHLDKPESVETIPWLKKKYLAAAAETSHNQRAGKERQESINRNYAYDLIQRSEDDLAERKEITEAANDNYAYNLMVVVRNGKVEAVPVKGPVDQEALHASMVEQRKREMERKRHLHAERSRHQNKTKAGGFKTVKMGKDTILKDYEYDLDY